MTLTQAAVVTKKGIVILVGLIVLGFTFKLLYDFGYQIYRHYYPPAEDLPNMKFGKLPKISFPASKSTANFTYSLDTKTGGLPQSPKLIKVYFIPQAGVSLLSPDRSKSLAARFGFISGPENVSPVQVRFKDDKGASMTIDLPTSNFSFDRLAEIDPKQDSGQAISSSDELVKDVQRFLENKQLLPDDLQDARSSVYYNAGSQAESDRAEVTFWPKDIDQLPVVTSDFRYGLVKVTVYKALNEATHFPKIDYYYWPVDATTFATYSLKSPEQAFEQLKAGGGYFSLEPPSNQASITNVSLAYYESQDYSPYLQPVYVFAGSNFAAYVPAIDSSQIQ